MIDISHVIMYVQLSMDQTRQLRMSKPRELQTRTEEATKRWLLSQQMSL